jgi:hypothetical protein
MSSSSSNPRDAPSRNEDLTSAYVHVNNSDHTRISLPLWPAGPLGLGAASVGGNALAAWRVRHGTCHGCICHRTAGSGKRDLLKSSLCGVAAGSDVIFWAKPSPFRLQTRRDLLRPHFSVRSAVGGAGRKGALICRRKHLRKVFPPPTSADSAERVT